MKTQKFSNEAIKQLGNYVYRLIDPRNGNTFYVGRGGGNRVFAHVNDALENFDNKNYITSEEKEGSIPTKVERIREINKSGLEVIHVIQRWGLTLNEAKEVEASLIDSYPGLDNAISGYDRDRGVVSAFELNNALTAEEFLFNSDDKFIVIKIRPETNQERGNYEATRSSWVLNLERAKNYKIVLSVISGVVVEVYKVDKWKRDPEIKNRIYFEGSKAKEEIRNQFINKRLPEMFRRQGSSNPAQYSQRD